MSKRVSNPHYSRAANAAAIQHHIPFLRETNRKKSPYPTQCREATMYTISSPLFARPSFCFRRVVPSKGLYIQSVLFPQPPPLFRTSNQTTSPTVIKLMRMKSGKLQKNELKMQKPRKTTDTGNARITVEYTFPPLLNHRTY